jgi:predicted nucleotidyltransferase
MRSSETLAVRAAVAADAAVTLVPDVEAALVFGSVARRSADAISDVDLLLATREHVPVRDLVARLRNECDLASVAISAQSWAHLATLRNKGSMFFRHLQVEGKILEDASGRLKALIAPPVVTVDIESYRTKFARSLAMYSDVDRLGSFHLFALAHIYVLAKRAAQLCVQEAGQDIYDPRLVFEEVTRLHPELKDDLDLIRRLRRIHAVVRGIAPSADAIDSSCNAESVVQARRVVERLLHS